MKLENIFQYGRNGKESSVSCFVLDIADYIGEKQQRHEAVSIRWGWLTFTWGLVLWSPTGSGNILFLEVVGPVDGAVLAPAEER